MSDRLQGGICTTALQIIVISDRLGNFYHFIWLKRVSLEPRSRLSLSKRSEEGFRSQSVRSRESQVE